MKKHLVVAVILVFVIAGFVWVTESSAADEKSDSKAKLTYVPPKLGKPGARVGGGTRGIAPAKLQVIALVPDHPAMTHKASPALCWHQSQATSAKIEIAIDDGKSVKPFLEKSLGKSERAGIQCFNLAQQGIALTPEVEYQWFVVVISDAEHRSKDLVSGGSVLYRKPAEALQETLKKAQPEALPKIFAESGYWYDAVEAVLSGLRERPNDQNFKDMKAQLLEQAGIRIE